MTSRSATYGGTVDMFEMQFMMVPNRKVLTILHSVLC